MNKNIIITRAVCLFFVCYEIDLNYYVIMILLYFYSGTCVKANRIPKGDMLPYINFNFIEAVEKKVNYGDFVKFNEFKWNTVS